MHGPRLHRVWDTVFPVRLLSRVLVSLAFTILTSYMQPTVLLATNNQNKIRELREILQSMPASLVSPKDAGIDVHVEETGRTYVANARKKALAFARASGLVALADDSGLEVTALDGAPGVYSARYAGEGAGSADRIALLLRNLHGVPWERRQARFVAVVTIAAPDGRVRWRLGECRGMITFAPQGAGGFGYDPVFYMPEFGCTMAELPGEIKNRVSHRARAALRVIPLLGAVYP
jgi:XTP/dITP diphosphohydrolase